MILGRGKFLQPWSLCSPGMRPGAPEVEGSQSWGCSLLLLFLQRALWLQATQPMNQPWGQTTPEGTETASMMVLETSLQPCLSLPLLVYHPGKSSSLDSVGLGLETVVRWRGRVSTAAWQSVLALWPWGSWGQALWEHNLSWRTEEDTGTGASPALDQPPDPPAAKP